jgi:hypothetical protein
MFVFFVVFTLYTNKSCQWFHLTFGSSMFGFEVLRSPSQCKYPYQTKGYIDIVLDHIISNY